MFQIIIFNPWKTDPQTKEVHPRREHTVDDFNIVNQLQNQSRPNFPG